MTFYWESNHNHEYPNEHKILVILRQCMGYVNVLHVPLLIGILSFQILNQNLLFFLIPACVLKTVFEHFKKRVLLKSSSIKVKITISGAKRKQIPHKIIK